MLAKRTFILGGAASGKSVFAENLLESGTLRLHYLATSQVFDDEMQEKVDIHQSRRDARWTTHEAPLDLGPSLSTLSENDAVLIDCATMWLSNHMLAHNNLKIAQHALLAALNNTPAHWVIVSNEVGHGIVPDNKLARQFREAQGRLNILLAGAADTAVLVVSGLPQVLKGTL